MYIAYIYDKNNSIVAQIEDIFSVDIVEKLNDINRCSFSIFFDNQYCNRNILKVFRKVILKKQTENSWEQTLFIWIIRGCGWNINKLDIKLESFDYLLKRRKIHQNYNFSNQSINNIFQTILDEINNRYDTKIILDCWILDQISKSFEKWKDVFSIIQEICLNKYEFWFFLVWQNFFLKIKNTIWIDRTIWENFLQYKYDLLDSEDRNIDNFSFFEDWENFGNWVVVKDWSNYFEENDTDSIFDFWLIETTLSVNWDWNNEAIAYIQEHKDSTIEYDSQVKSNNYFEVNLWDLVSVYFFTWNEMAFFDWNMKIVEKSYKSWDLENINFKLSKWKILSKNLVEQIWEMKEKLKNLELKN